MYSPADITIYNVKTNKTIKEKSLVAFDLNTTRIIAFGNEVYNNLENYDARQVAVASPIHQGLADDYTVAEKLMNWMLVRAYGKRLRNAFLGGPKIAVIMSAPMGNVPLKAFEDLFYSCGASDVIFIYKSNLGNACSFETAVSEILQKNEKIALIVEIGKDDPKEYVKEMLDELETQSRYWGVGNEELLSMLQQKCNTML
ncbi:MAG: rod shape-determining protein [Lachnospiraceae bacterium]